MKSRIAIIANSLSLGGAERISTLLAEWLQKKGIEVALITLNKDREKGYELSPKINRIAVNKYSKDSKITIISGLRKSLKEFKPSLVLVMGVPLCVYVMPATFGLKIPVIVSERNDPSRFAGKGVTKFVSRKLMYFAKGYIFQTKDAKAYYSKSIRNRGTVIPNPLTAEYMPEPYQGKRRKRLVAVGRLVPQKNHAMLIRAFSEVVKQYPEYTLTIYGNGSEHENLKRLTDSLHITDKVYLPGTTKDIFNKILDAEIFVLSSDFEGMPNALIEAMALGIPVISTDCPCGGPAALIDHMENGILVPTGDTKKMAEAINILINDKELAKELGQNALNIKKTLDSEVICERWWNFIK